MAEPRARADDSRPRGDDGSVPSKFSNPVREATRERDCLRFTAVAGARSDRSSKQPLFAQLDHRPRVPTRKRPAAALDVTKPRPLAHLSYGPSEWSKLPVEEADADRPRRWQIFCAAVFDREHGVLERAVVELHHVRPGNALAAQATREIYVDYIEASRAER